jgi:hypothetical protein
MRGEKLRRITVATVMFTLTMLLFAALSSCSFFQLLLAYGSNSSNTVITMSGKVEFWASCYMFEDFWLQTQNGPIIPVVVRLSGLPTPPKDSVIEVVGTMEYSTLEGGFYYLDAQSWSYVASAPEFPSLLILSVFMIVGLLAAVVLKKRCPED